MPVVSRRPSAAITDSGEVIVVTSEASQYSIPRYYLNFHNDNLNQFIQQDVWPMGSRLCFLNVSNQRGINGQPTPVLVIDRGAGTGQRPIGTTVLNNVVDPTLCISPQSGKVFMMWWWNAWNSPEESPLPKPPNHRYLPHTPPDEKSPALMRSVVPNIAVPSFDPHKPFWIAPISDGYQYDYYPEDSEKIGESKVDGLHRMPKTPGSLKFQEVISRGLLDWPPPERPTTLVIPPEPEHVNWTLRSGIKCAGEHLIQASYRDSPTFVPALKKSPLGDSTEMAYLPEAGIPIPSNCTIEDHLLFVNVLKAFFDNANLTQSTRLLMVASGKLYPGATLETIPTIWETVTNGKKTIHDPWPSESEIVSDQTVLILDEPQIVSMYDTKINQRMVINSDMALYPAMGFADSTWYPFSDGRVHNTATGKDSGIPAVDWLLGEPTTSYGKIFDIFRGNLDPRSF